MELAKDALPDTTKKGFEIPLSDDARHILTEVATRQLRSPELQAVAFLEIALGLRKPESDLEPSPKATNGTRKSR